MIAGEAARLGPDLSKQSALCARDPEYLRRAILDPNADIAEGFEPDHDARRHGRADVCHRNLEISWSSYLAG